MADYVSGDMVRGHIDSIILNSLIDGDKDTGLIREEIEKRAAGKFQLKQGTFYSALQRIVKNGLVIEYRTTGADGVRRKFFQLTEKGKTHIEKNQSNWTVSQEVLSSLLDAETPQKRRKNGEQPEISVQTAEKLPDFSSSENFSEERRVPKFGETLFGSESEPELTFESALPVFDEPTNEENGDGENVADDEPEIPEFVTAEEDAPTTFDDILNILAKAEESKVNDEAEITDKTDENVTTVKTDETDENEEKTLNDLSEIISGNAKNVDLQSVNGKQTEQNAENYSNESTAIDTVNQTIEQTEISETKQQSQANNVLKVDFSSNEQVFCEKSQDYSQKSVENGQSIQSEKSFYAPNNNDETFERVQTEQKQLAIDEVAPAACEPDDYLDSDDLPMQKEYREILSKIFASDDKKQRVNEEKTVSSREIREYEREQRPVESAEYAKNDEEYNDVIVDELDFSSTREKDVRTETAKSEIDEKTEKIKKRVLSPVGSFDYSDILQLSKEEGFRVSTADKTNKNELGKILINKLNFHTALIFFAILAVETFIVYFALDNVVNLGISSYLVFCAIAFLLPLVYGAIYFFAPKRAVGEITTFKNAFETALIITLNLFLLIIAFAIVTNLDFSNVAELNAKIFIPVLIALNVPLFVIIRYSILENQTYFS